MKNLNININIKLKLILPVVMLTIAITLFQILSFKNATHQILLSQLTSKGYSIAESISYSAQTILLKKQHNNIQTFIDKYIDINGVAYIYIKNENGKIIAHSFTPQIPPELLQQNDSLEKKDFIYNLQGNKTIEIQMPILSGPLGSINLGMALEKEQKKILAPIVAKLIFWCVFLLLLGLAILYIYLNCLIQPLISLTRMTKQVLINDKEFKEIQKYSNDEIGELTESFNKMIIQLKNHSENLEQLVNEKITIIVQNSKQLARQTKALDIAALVSETDTRGIITYANDTFCKISQYSQVEIIGKPHSFINSGVHSQAFWNECWQKISAGKTWSGEVCNKAKDGSLYWVHSTIIPIKNARKKVTGYSAIRVNITSKKHAEKMLQHQLKLASIGEMAASVGHEINNPLAIVVGMTDLIKQLISKETIHNPKIFSGLNKINEAHERIRKIVDGLRTFARSDQDINEVISVNDAVAKTVNLSSEIYQKEGVNIIVNMPKVELYTSGILGKLQQIIMNLVSNAKDASIGMDKRDILISLHEDKNETLLLSVTDYGGVTSNDQSQIKDHFSELAHATVLKPFDYDEIYQALVS